VLFPARGRPVIPIRIAAAPFSVPFPITPPLRCQTMTTRLSGSTGLTALSTSKGSPKSDDRPPPGFIGFLGFIEFIEFVKPNQPNKPNRLNKPNRPTPLQIESAVVTWGPTGAVG